jgi:hypothetical protein
MSMERWIGSTSHGSQGLRSQLNEDRPILDLQQRLKREGYIFSAMENKMGARDLMIPRSNLDRSWCDGRLILYHTKSFSSF